MTVADTPLARLVADRLAALGITQREAARRAGLSQAGVRKLVAGERPRPSAETLLALAVALELDAAELIAACPEPRTADQKSRKNRADRE